MLTVHPTSLTVVRPSKMMMTTSGLDLSRNISFGIPSLTCRQDSLSPVILDPKVTVPTPEWLFLSTGIRAVDHAVETYLSIDANAYTDGACLQALRLLGQRIQVQPPEHVADAALERVELRRRRHRRDRPPAARRSRRSPARLERLPSGPRPRAYAHGAPL